MSHRASLATARGIHLWKCWTVVCMECIILYSSGNKITTTTTTKLLYSNEREEMLRYLEIRANAFSCLAAFVQLILTCWLKENLSSRKTPNILTCGSGFKVISSIHSDILNLSILLDDNNINWNFDGFACKPFTENHPMILLQSVSKFETTSWTHREAVDMELSSA